jgi:hypothetical protein
MDSFMCAYVSAILPNGSIGRRRSTLEMELDAMRADYLAVHPIPQRPSVLARLKDVVAKITAGLRPELAAGRVAH